MKVAISADHAGFRLKETILDRNILPGIRWIDLGTGDETSVDYPDFGTLVARSVSSGEADRGIAVCGTGVGISIAANRHPDIRAAVCTDSTIARLSREHNNANVLCLGARMIGIETALDIVKTFLITEFSGDERHARRIDKLSSKGG